jgi:uncharacterized protein
MKVEFSCILTILIILFIGCGGDNPTEPEDTELDLASAQLAPFLNAEAARQFAENPWDVNKDGKIDIFDLVMVAQHIGEDVEAPTQGEVQERPVLELINTTENQKSIQITGIGSISGEPDIVILTLGVSVERKTVKEARDEAAEAMTLVLDSLKANGVADKDLRTQHFSINQQFDFIRGQQVFRGYAVTNIVSATIRNLDVIGQSIDDAAAAGGDLVRVHSIQFAIDDPKSLQMEARIAAMRDALAKAQTLATEGGVTLGKPISISEGGFAIPPPIPFARDASAEGIATPIQPGQLDVSVTVNVIFAIE